jgi:hypothetical protein
LRATVTSSAHVLEAQLTLAGGVDPAAVGAAVTVELCGRWEHEGPCRWPHNSAIDASREPALFRTLFVCDEADAARVGQRIERALRGGAGWRVLSLGERAVEASERALAERLRGGPRAAG